MSDKQFTGEQQIPRNKPPISRTRVSLPSTRVAMAKQANSSKPKPEDTEYWFLREPLLSHLNGALQKVNQIRNRSVLRPLTEDEQKELSHYTRMSIQLKTEVTQCVSEEEYSHHMITKNRIVAGIRYSCGHKCFVFHQSTLEEIINQVITYLIEQNPQKQIQDLQHGGASLPYDSLQKRGNTDDMSWRNHTVMKPTGKTSYDCEYLNKTLVKMNGTVLICPVCQRLKMTESLVTLAPAQKNRILRMKPSKDDNEFSQYYKSTLLVYPILVSSNGREITAVSWYTNVASGSPTISTQSAPAMMSGREPDRRMTRSPVSPDSTLSGGSPTIASQVSDGCVAEMSLSQMTDDSQYSQDSTESKAMSTMSVKSSQSTQSTMSAQSTQSTQSTQSQSSTGSWQMISPRGPISPKQSSKARIQSAPSSPNKSVEVPSGRYMPPHKRLKEKTLVGCEVVCRQIDDGPMQFYVKVPKADK